MESMKSNQQHRRGDGRGAKDRNIPSIRDLAQGLWFLQGDSVQYQSWQAQGTGFKLLAK